MHHLPSKMAFLWVVSAIFPKALNNFFLLLSQFIKQIKYWKNLSNISRSQVAHTHTYTSYFPTERWALELHRLLKSHCSFSLVILGDVHVKGL